MLVNNAIRNLIRENKLYQIKSIMQGGQGDGMQTAEQALKDLARRREITRDEAIQAANNPKLFDDGDGARRRPPSR